MIQYHDARGAIDAPRTFAEAILEGIAAGGGLFVPERLPPFAVDRSGRWPTVPCHARGGGLWAFGLDVAAARHARSRDGPTARTSTIPRRAGRRGGRGAARARAVARPDERVQGHGAAVHAAVLLRGASSAQAGARRARRRLPHPRRHERRHRQGGARGLRRPRAHQHRRLLPRRRRLRHPAQADGHAARATTSASSACAATSTTARPPSRPPSPTRPSPPSCARAHRLLLSSANSINWGRLLPQIVYYVSAYADMVASGGVEPASRWTSACPPATSATSWAPTTRGRWACRSAGCICASNENNVLADFIATGVYDISDARSCHHPLARRWTSSSRATSSGCSSTSPATRSASRAG